MNPVQAAVLDEAELTESIHEEADTRASGADHIGQGRLADLWQWSQWLIFATGLRKQDQCTRQALLAGVKELVDEISLNACIA